MPTRPRAEQEFTKDETLLLLKTAQLEICRPETFPMAASLRWPACAGVNWPGSLTPRRGYASRLITRRMERHRARRGKKISPVHSWRHTTGTMLRRAFKDPKQVLGHLGHTPSATPGFRVKYGAFFSFGSLSRSPTVALIDTHRINCCGHYHFNKGSRK